MLSELPEDLNRQYIPMGPPPNFYSARPSKPPVCEPSTVLVDIFPFLSSVDKSQLDSLKYERNEYNPQIPPVVRRYTNVEPLSPFFRSDRAKYGYGGLADVSDTVPWCGIAAGITGFINYRKTKDVKSAAICALGAALITKLAIKVI